MINFLANKVIFNNYDLIITIDSPDFNYPLSKKIKKNNYNKKLIHIVAPTVWAWRKQRAKKFSNIYDEILILFKFEEKYFKKFNIKTTFIGHPIYYINNKNIFNKKTNTNKMIAFLPGSRSGELKKLFTFFNLAYNHLLTFDKNITIFIPTLPHLKNIIIKKTHKWKLKVIVTTKKDIIDENFLLTNYALVCSGTASLEVAKRQIPQLIIYKFNFFTELLASFFIKIKFANIINIIENKMIIPELTNSKLYKKSFIREFKNLLNDTKSNRTQILEIKKSMKGIETSIPPFQISAERIIDNL